MLVDVLKAAVRLFQVGRDAPIKTKKGRIVHNVIVLRTRRSSQVGRTGRAYGERRAGISRFQPDRDTILSEDGTRGNEQKNVTRRRILRASRPIRRAASHVPLLRARSRPAPRLW